MNILTVSVALLGSLVPAIGQEAVPKWNVEIPASIPDVTSAPVAEKPIDFTILSSHTKRVEVSESPEMPDLPAVEGTINVTIEKVVNPGLPDPPPPLPALPPDDPAVLARLEELRQTYRGTELVFLSASVHLETHTAEKARTLLRIYPNGKTGKEVVAWSNLNFLHLTGQGGYRVNQPDGTTHDIGLLMGVGPIYSEAMRRMAARSGRNYDAPEIPDLPDLAVTGPAFVVCEGDSDSPAMDTLEQLHDLFRKSGKSLKDQYDAREKQQSERKAYLLANPPKPQDITIRVWKRSSNQAPQEKTR